MKKILAVFLIVFLFAQVSFADEKPNSSKKSVVLSTLLGGIVGFGTGQMYLRYNKNEDFPLYSRLTQNMVIYATLDLAMALAAIIAYMPEGAREDGSRIRPSQKFSNTFGKIFPLSRTQKPTVTVKAPVT